MPMTVSVMATDCCILFLGSENIWTSSSEPPFPACSVAKHHLNSLAFFFSFYLSFCILIKFLSAALLPFLLKNSHHFSAGTDASLAFLRRAVRWLMRAQRLEARGNLALDEPGQKNRTQTPVFLFLFLFPL